MKTFTIEIAENEYWYGGATFDSCAMPYDKDTVFEAKLLHDNEYNQVTSALVSSKGRYVYNDGFDIKVENGVITLSYDGTEPTLKKSGNTLKSGFLALAKEFFPADGKTPAKEFFTKPQFNSWIEIERWQSQERLEKYADEIVKNGYPCGVFMIDSEWAHHYGALRFDTEKFYDAEKLLKKLKDLGFKVMVWESPFISPDLPEFRELKEKGFLVKSADGKIAVREWWDGMSALLDMSNPGAREWLAEKNARLMEMGVDGFKMDAGDVEYYRDDDITYGGVTARGQCEAWASFGTRYEFNELRASYNVGGKALFERQADKWHIWAKPGLAAIIPETIVMGLLGYPYNCPDMVGGGSVGKVCDIDEELFVRFAGAAALTPMMQFSASPWSRISKEGNEACLKFAKLHEEFGEYIYKYAQHASKTNEPIARHLAYAFPEEGFEKVMTAYMLGDDYLVAPVLEQGATERKIRLPKGKWQYQDGTIYEGGQEVVVPAPLDVLPYFKKL